MWEQKNFLLKSNRKQKLIFKRFRTQTINTVYGYSGFTFNQYYIQSIKQAILLQFRKTLIMQANVPKHSKVSNQNIPENIEESIQINAHNTLNVLKWLMMSH